MTAIAFVPAARAAAVAAALTLALVLLQPARAAGHAVTIQGFAFAPATLTLAVGDTVTWTNMDTVPHTATSDAGVTPAFDTGTVGASGTTLTFAAAGTFAYHCAVHPNMKATVVVTAAGSTQDPVTAATPAAPATGSGRLATGSGASHSGVAVLAALGAMLVAAGAWRALGRR